MNEHTETETTEPTTAAPIEHTETEPAKPAPLSEANTVLAARTVHEAVRGYRQAIGHNNLADWDNSPDWEQARAHAVIAAVADHNAGPTELFGLFEGDKRFVDASPQKQTQYRIAAAVGAAVVAVLRGVE